MVLNGTVKVAQDPTLPVGRCVLLVEGDIVYAGRIGGLDVRQLDRFDAVLILHPHDFADGQAFFTQMLN